MEPNTSEYLTPQTKRKNKQVRRQSESNEALSFMKQINDSLFEKLMNCPLKRNLVLNLIASEHDNIEEYKKNQIKQKSKEKTTPGSSSTPSKKNRYESPVALLRRKALEQQTSSSPTNFPQSENRPNSRVSEASSSRSSSPLLFGKILNGVIAFVEVKSHGQDRSQGVKILMKNLGADVRDTFTKDVTHVVFKDGSFTTYQKARLLNVYLVSVLWIDACKNYNFKVDESRYPAFGTDTFNHNVSAFCSQLQKDYEDIIRDELKRSLASGTPLPSTQTIIHRRRTLMTPGSSRNFSQEFSSTQDREVAEIIQHQTVKDHFFADSTIAPTLSPIITSDEDSDLEAIIDGNFVSKKEKHIYPKPWVEETPSPTVNMELTNIEFSNKNAEVTPVCDVIDSSIKVNTSTNDASNSLYDLKTPKLIPSKKSLSTSNKDNSSDSSNNSLYKRKTRTIAKINITSDLLIQKDSNMFTADAKPPSPCKPKLKSPAISIISKNSAKASPIVNRIKIQSDSELNLQLTLEKNKFKDGSNNKEPVSAPRNEKSSSISTLQLSTGKTNNEKSTSMSSLRISSASNQNIQNKQQEDVGKFPENISRKSGSCNSNKSFSPLQPKILDNILETLDKPLPPDSNITQRRKRNNRKSTIPKTQLFNNNDRNESLNEEKESDVSEKNPTIKSVSEKKPVRRRTRKSRLYSDDEAKCATKTERENVTNEKKDQERSNFDFGETRDENSEKRTKVEQGTRKHKHVNSSTEDCENGLLESSNKTKRIRKLYDPDECFARESVGDQIERENRRLIRDKSKNRKPGVVIVPDIIQTKSALILSDSTKEFLNKNNIDLRDILNPPIEESSADKNDASPKKKRKKNKEVENIIDGDRDEQKQLAEEILRNRTPKKNVDETGTENTNLKQPTQRRQSIRLVQKTTAKGSSSDSDNITPLKIVKQNTAAKTTGKINRKKTSQKQVLSTTTGKTFKFSQTSNNRRSTMEFQSQSDMNTTKKLKINKLKNPSIVCTKMHKDNVVVFNQIVKKLGGFFIEDEVTNKTTHLVAGESKRTINMLRAIARGCWILKHEWLLTSLEAGKWLPEEDFEVNDFSPAVQQCRIQRQAFGSSYTVDIFKGYGYIYVAKGSTPRCSDLRELITLCKGKITTILRNAVIVVGGYLDHEGVTCVTETWVLDCIQFNKKCSFRKYVIKEDNKVVL